MNLRSIEYVLQEAFTGIKRNGLMAFASISTIALSLCVLGVFALAALSANNFAQLQISRFEIVTFVPKEVGDAAALTIVEEIRKIDGVKSVELRSRDEEWAKFKHDNPNFQNAGLPTNPLNYAIDVHVVDKTKIASIAEKIRKIENIKSVNENREVFGRVMALAKVTKAVSILGVIVLLITTVFIISNAIKLTLYARRREIRIMQLVGATNSFIRVPLVIEGMVFGAIGSFAAFILINLGSKYLSKMAEKITRILGQFQSGISNTELAFGLLFLGVVIGAVGSLVSIRRFLHD